MNIDLNLLRVFDILMAVRSVSRAATRLGMTQSAVSHALARLRDQLGDRLLVRARNGLRPSARYTEIAQSIREGLWRLRDALAPADFDPAASTRGFTISASSQLCATMLPTIIERARAQAPLARLRITAPGADFL